MKTSEALLAAKELISTPEKWIKGRYATENNGNECTIDSDKATCFCSLGAIRRVAMADFSAGYGAEELLCYVIGRDIPTFNDATLRTHADVMAAFSMAISYAQVEERSGRLIDGEWSVTKAIMSRSARVLMEGWVREPGDSF